jgi:hypothetical protein
VTDVLQHLRGLLNRATPGPWNVSWAKATPEIVGEQWVGALREGAKDDAALIVALRNHAEALIECVEALERIAALTVEDGPLMIEIAWAALSRLTEGADG